MEKQVVQFNRETQTWQTEGRDVDVDFVRFSNGTPYVRVGTSGTNIKRANADGAEYMVVSDHGDNETVTIQLTDASGVFQNFDVPIEVVQAARAKEFNLEQKVEGMK